jgi:hypothetical protein
VTLKIRLQFVLLRLAALLCFALESMLFINKTVDRVVVAFVCRCRVVVWYVVGVLFSIFHFLNSISISRKKDPEGGGRRGNRKRKEKKRKEKKRERAGRQHCRIWTRRKRQVSRLSQNIRKYQKMRKCENAQKASGRHGY